MSTTAASIGSGGIALLVLTVICWFLSIVSLSGTIGQEAHGDAAFGQGLSWFAAIVFAGLTWLWLGGLLLKAGTQDRVPGWAATVFYLGSIAAVAASLFLLQDPKITWAAVVPALLPPILAFYVFALYHPSLGAFFSGTSGRSAVWGSIIILCLAPWPLFFQKLDRDRERRIENARSLEEWKTNERARKRAENLAKLQAMTPAEPLVNWYGLLDEDSGVRPEAIEALKHVERRQADIEYMLSNGIATAMMLLPDLDLKPTPHLCEAARTFMLASAKISRVRPKQDPRPYVAGGDVEHSLPAIRWLQARGCNCDEGVAALQASVESHQDTPDRKTALASLAGLREKH